MQSSDAYVCVMAMCHSTLESPELSELLSQAGPGCDHVRAPGVGPFEPSTGNRADAEG